MHSRATGSHTSDWYAHAQTTSSLHRACGRRHRCQCRRTSCWATTDVRRRGGDGSADWFGMPHLQRQADAPNSEAARLCAARACNPATLRKQDFRDAERACIQTAAWGQGALLATRAEICTGLTHSALALRQSSGVDPNAQLTPGTGLTVLKPSCTCSCLHCGPLVISQGAQVASMSSDHQGEMQVQRATRTPCELCSLSSISSLLCICARPCV